jgi:hypothetical protein
MNESVPVMLTRPDPERALEEGEARGENSCTGTPSTVHLSANYCLTTEHAASRCGQPVLVYRPTGEAFGPGDVMQAYPSWGFMPALHVAIRLAERSRLDDTDRATLDAFCAG